MKNKKDGIDYGKMAIGPDEAYWRGGTEPETSKQVYSRMLNKYLRRGNIKCTVNSVDIKR